MGDAVYRFIAYSTLQLPGSSVTHNVVNSKPVDDVRSLMDNWLSLLRWYATGNHRPVDEDIDPHFVSLANRRNMTAPVVYLVSIGLSFLNVYLSLIVFFLFPLYYIFPSHIDLHLTPTSHSEVKSKEHEGSTGEDSSISEGLEGEKANP
ncbi:MAG TPA: hypothetical protein VFZ02_10015 [Ktedonobacteraceae bacterium]